MKPRGTQMKRIPAPPEPRSQGDPDPDLDAHDLPGFEELRRRLGRHEVVVDHGQAADSLDPGVHDQVGGGFAALGVGVMDVVIEGDLVPLLGHLQEMVALQLLADQARSARGGHPEVMGQFELPFGIPLDPDELLHGLEEDPGRVVAQRTVGDVHHLVVEGPEGAQAVVGFADLQGMEEVGHGVGDAEPLGGGHLLDAVGVQVRVEEVLEALSGGLPAEDFLDHLEEGVVFSFEEKFGE